MSHMVMEHLGCKVITFTRPLDALGELSTILPAVVVTDYFMPQMNGLDFIRRAAPVVPRASFLLITGHNLDPVEDELLRLRPLRGRMSKPFGWRKLADEILRVWPNPAVAPAQHADATSV